MMLIFARFLFLFFLLPVVATSAKTPIKYHFGNNATPKRWQPFLKKIDWIQSKEVNGLQFFIKPMQVEKNLSFTVNDLSFKQKNLKEQLSIIDKMPLNKNRLSQRLLLESNNSVNIIGGIKNISKKTIFFVIDSIDFHNIIYAAKYGSKLTKQYPSIPPIVVLPHKLEYPLSTKDVVKLEPGEFYPILRNLVRYELFKNKGIYQIYLNYSWKSDSKKSTFLGFSETGDPLSDITLPIWEGELQSNTLTVVVH